jgi:hypothetical protein
MREPAAVTESLGIVQAAIDAMTTDELVLKYLKMQLLCSFHEDELSLGLRFPQPPFSGDSRTIREK